MSKCCKNVRLNLGDYIYYTHVLPLSSPDAMKSGMLLNLRLGHGFRHILKTNLQPSLGTVRIILHQQNLECDLLIWYLDLYYQFAIHGDVGLRENGVPRTAGDPWNAAHRIGTCKVAGKKNRIPFQAF